LGVISKQFGRDAGPDEAHPLSLQLLFSEALPVDAAALTEALRQFHPALADAKFQIATRGAEGTMTGLATWGNEAVEVLAFEAPMPSDAVEACVQPAHCGPEVKERARAHRSHALLYYAGPQTDPLERYAALAIVAAAFATVADTMVLNEAAQTFVHGSLLTPGPEFGDGIAWLHDLPLLMLYCGFVKITVLGQPGIWMRTAGNHVFDLPDLAYHAEGHQEGQSTFEMFSDILDYLRNSGATLGEGHTMQVGADTFMRARVPTEDEHFLESPGTMLVTEIIPADEINRPWRDNG
jgi:hypothetical protein